MTLRNLILAETINQEKILTENKVSAFVKNVLDRYSNIRAPRIEAVYSKEIYNKNPKDKGLYTDDNKACNKTTFKKLAIAKFNELNNTKLSNDDFIKILDLYLSNYLDVGFLKLKPKQ